MRISHEFPPFYNKDSKILILGSIPSPKSREQGFYYGHPKNRFWKTLSIVFSEKEPNTISEKKQFLTKYQIALWDVLESCEIKGASDSTIKNYEVNDLNIVIKNSNIKKIYTTGRIAYQLYQKHCYKNTNIEAIYLPSTSPANCSLDLEQLVKYYNVLNN